MQVGVCIQIKAKYCVAQAAFKINVTMDNKDLPYTNSTASWFHSYQN